VLLRELNCFEEYIGMVLDDEAVGCDGLEGRAVCVAGLVVDAHFGIVVIVKVMIPVNVGHLTVLALEWVSHERKADLTAEGDTEWVWG